MKKFTKEDTMLLLIDHQQGTLKSCRNRDHKAIISSLRTLARFASALHIPVIITSTQEDQMQGRILKDLQELLPKEYENRIKRSGIINAWDEQAFKKAVSAHSHRRSNIIIAGITNDVCVVWPAVSLKDEGFQVQVAVDAGGSPSQLAEDTAQLTWQQNGVRTSTISQLISEFIHDWTSEQGQAVMKILHEEVM